MTNTTLLAFITARPRRPKSFKHVWCEWCGVRHVGGPCPSPEVIAARCRAVRRKWQPRDFVVRSGGTPAEDCDGRVSRDETAVRVLTVTERELHLGAAGVVDDGD